MNVKKRSLLVSVLLVLVVLTACAAPAPAPAPTAAPAAAPTAAPAAAEPTQAPAAPAAAEGLNCDTMKGEALVWVMSFDPHVNGWNNVAEGFMKKYPNIRVTVEGQGGQGDMLAKYVAALSSKSGADIFTTRGTWSTSGR